MVGITPGIDRALVHALVILAKTGDRTSLAHKHALPILLHIRIGILHAAQHTVVILVYMVSKLGVTVVILYWACFHTFFSVVLFESVVGAGCLAQLRGIVTVQVGIRAVVLAEGGIGVTEGIQ